MENIEKTLLLQDISTNSVFLQNLLLHRFKSLFDNVNPNDKDQIEFNLLLKFSIFSADNFEDDIQKNEENFFKALSLFSEQSQLQVFYVLLNLFLKEAQLGSSYMQLNIDRKLKMEKQDKNQIRKLKNFQNLNLENQEIFKKIQEMQIPINKNINLYNHKYLKLKSFIVRENLKLIEYLSIDGEQWMRIMPYSHIFALLKILVDNLVKTFQKSTYYLWKSRISFIHNQILGTPCGTLYQDIMTNFEKFLQSSPQLGLKNSFLSQIYVEYSHILLFFYKYEKSESCLLKAQQLLKIKLSLTGKMGVRTKYQTFKTAQLVAQVHSTEDQPDIKKENENEIKQNMENQSESEEYKAIQEEEENFKTNLKDIISQNIPKNHQLDDECILYEQPVVDDDDVKEKNEKSELSVEEQILILGMIKHLDKTMPHDELFHSQVIAYCTILVNKSNNWLVYSNGLFMRSVYEIVRFKKMERALAQMEELIIQFAEKEPKLYERGIYKFSLNYPLYIDFQKIIAENFFKIGMVMSACQIYERLHMFEESISCVARSGQLDRAKKMCLAQFQIETTPKLLVIYGDITQDFTQYKKAWKLSNKKYGKAQLALGKVYFYQQKWEKAIKAFRKAIAINSYQANPWFTMGCAYLRIENWKGAIESFSSVITIDESEGQAWANLANAFLQVGKEREAQSTLEQAVKHCERSWQMWSNLMLVSLQNKKFYKFFECIEKLLSMDHKELIDQQITKKVNQVFAFNLKIYPESKHKRTFEVLKNRIDRLYNLMGTKMGERAHVWDSYVDFQELQIIYADLVCDYQEKNN